MFRDSQITSTQFANYQLKAVEDFGENGGKQLLWQHTDGFYYTWKLTESWAFSSATTTSATNAANATTLLVNFGLVTSIEKYGTTLLTVDNSGRVLANNNPILFKGSPITSSQFTGYQLKAVEDFGDNGGKQLLWEHADGYYYTWNLTETWEFSSATTTPATNATATTRLLETFELVTSIEKNGATLLTIDKTGGVLANNQPILFRGSQITSNQFANYELKAAEDFGESGGKQLLWKHSDGYYYKWNLTETWEFKTGATISASNNAVLQGFGLIAGGETSGNTSLIINADGTVFADTAAILYQGSPITFTQFRNYEPLATEDFGDQGGKQLLFRHSTGFHYVWTLSATWEYQSGLKIPVENAAVTSEILTKFGL